MVFKMRAIYEKENRRTRTSMKNSKAPVSADYRKHLKRSSAAGIMLMFIDITMINDYVLQQYAYRFDCV